jgi:hypothetical protein
MPDAGPVFFANVFKLAGLRNKVADRAQYFLHGPGGFFTLPSQLNQLRDLDKTLEKDARR